MGAVIPVFSWDMDCVLGGRTDWGGGGYGWDGYGDILNQWYDIVANIILRMENNVPLAYALGLEFNHPIMSTIEGHGDRLER